MSITYGTALDNSQLSGTANFNGQMVAGTFSFTTVVGALLNAGNGQTEDVTFTPADTADYTTASGAVEVNVGRATPTINWAPPAAITYGTALSGTQLDASSSWTVGGTLGSVSGTFRYTPAAGAVLSAGQQPLSVMFTPADTTDYTIATGSTALRVNQATPTITVNPVNITYGTALDNSQLSGTANFNGQMVAGTFSFTTVVGALLNAGNGQTEDVTFTPTDTADYTTASGAVEVNVGQATPTINWAPPAAITYGTALSGTQLDASSSWTVGGTLGSVSGTFRYTPAAGAVLSAGQQPLSVMFTPADTTDYTIATGSTTLRVNQATPTITVNPVNIIYGTALDNSQLSGTATFVVGGQTVNVSGRFNFTTADGYVPNVGLGQTAAVTFTSTDTADYTTATANVTLNVVGTGATIVGNALYLVGGDTNDQISIRPIGTNPTGSTGIEVDSNLDKIHIDHTDFGTDPAHRITTIIISGFGGNDVVHLADTLTIATVVNETDGNDNIQLGNGNDTVVVGNGNDNVQAGDGNNSVTVGNGNDNIQLGDGNNIVVEGSGNDNVHVGNGDNLIVGGLGRHTIQAGNGDNILIDGRVALPQAGDTLAQVLSDWMSDIRAGDTAAQIGALLAPRMQASYNIRDPNTLHAGTGFDWFWAAYPPPASAELWGVGEHTDYGLLTILLQDDVGGLEVKSTSGWVAASPLPGSFVCNIGDMLDRMTRGVYRSTPHRVRNVSGRDRMSFPFFFDPNFFADARPIDLPSGEIAPDDRGSRWDQSSVHIFQGTYGEYLLSKVGKVFPGLKAKVL